MMVLLQFFCWSWCQWFFVRGKFEWNDFFYYSGL